MKKETAQPKVSTNSDDSQLSLIRAIRPIISEKSLFAVVITAIAYFWGWRFLYFYYASFGLDASFFSFSPIDIFSAGWRIYLITVGILIVAVFLLLLVQKGLIGMLRLRNPEFAVGVFSLFMLTGFGFALYVLYMFVFVFAAHITLRFYIFALASLLSIWLAYGVGESILGLKEVHNKTNRTIRFFNLVFPNSSFWLSIILIGFVILMAFFASYLGLQYRFRDTSESSRLAIVTMYTSLPLDIPNGREIGNGTWSYDNLRFLFKSNDFYFVFRLEEFEDNGVYIIPIKNVSLVQIRGWAYVLTHPNILSTPIP